MIEFTLSEVDSSWHKILAPHLSTINNILYKIDGKEVAPPRDRIFRLLTYPRSHFRIAIFGQDPYPGKGVADGFAFSQSADASVPASLRNIYKEYAHDLHLPTPTTTNLAPWVEQGVALLNRTLTTEVGVANAHLRLGWSEITSSIARSLGEIDCIAILWGKNAQELEPYFSQVIKSVHPSPLSARNGFFGSQPFTRANTLLQQSGRLPIDWHLP